MSEDEKQEWIDKVDFALNEIRPHLQVDGGNIEVVDVTEELVRVDSHLAQFHETVKSGDSIGRRLDFILQEMFREFTTIGSKTNHPEIGKLIVDIKTDMDKIKQQIANIE